MNRLGLGAFIRVVGLSAVIITGLILSSTNNAISQGQDMRNMPGMNMPQTSPSPSASPQKMETNMQMPSASPGASPQKMDMNMPMPGASPSASPMGQTPGMDMSGASMNMGPLLVMSDKGMGVRIG